MESNHVGRLLPAPIIEQKNSYCLNNSLNRHNLYGNSCRTNFYFFSFSSAQVKKNSNKMWKKNRYNLSYFFKFYFLSNSHIQIGSEYHWCLYRLVLSTVCSRKKFNFKEMHYIVKITQLPTQLSDRKIKMSQCNLSAI